MCSFFLFLFLFNILALCISAFECEELRNTLQRSSTVCTVINLRSKTIYTKAQLNKTKWIQFSHLNRIPMEFFKLFDNVKKLTAVNNEMSTVAAGTFEFANSLKEVYLSKNAIETISDRGFHGANYLEFLDLSHNRLTNLPTAVFNDNKYLRHINLTSNHFTKIDLNTFRTSHVSVYLNNNFIQSIKLVNTDLTILRLELSNNSLTDIDAISLLIDLNYLLLSSNPLGALRKTAFSKFENLVWLILSNTQLLDVPHGIFDNLSNLEKLDLSKNNLNVFNLNIFSRNCMKLEKLNISENNLTKIIQVESITKKCPVLNELNVKNNNFDNMYLAKLKDLFQITNIQLDIDQPGSVTTTDIISTLEPTVISLIESTGNKVIFNWLIIFYLTIFIVISILLK